LKGSFAASLFAVSFADLRGVEDDPALGTELANDDVQEVPSSATEVGPPEQALNTRRSAAGGVTAARAASPHLARPFDLTAHAE
jgi:hypothetical protein